MTTFEAPEDIHHEAPLRSPHLSDDADREFDKLVDGGVAVPSEAWREVTRKHGTTEWLGESTVQKIKDLSEEEDLPTAGPPQAGESDEDIRRRHREALSARDVSPPPGFDPNIASQSLNSLKSGEYTAGHTDQSQV